MRFGIRMGSDKTTTDDNAESLEFTGERFTPECVREIRYEHLHRYAFARELVRGRAVLDAACGEGYGAALLAATAATVVGVDLSAETVAHARERYAAPNLSFQAADCLHLPHADAVFDCVVSFETLEHLADHDGLLREFRRVLKPHGWLLVSSPDKAVYSEQQQNRNEYHVRELYRPELEALLRAHFPAYRLWGQRLLFHSAIWQLPHTEEAAAAGSGTPAFLQQSGGAIEPRPEPGHDPVYFLALCAANAADLPQPPAALSLFDDADESVYAHYYHEIRKNMAAGALLADRDRELARLRAELEAATGGTAGSDAGRADRRSWWRRLLGIDS
jgi:SAM-dependent methyltransferase